MIKLGEMKISVKVLFISGLTVAFVGRWGLDALVERAVDLADCLFEAEFVLDQRDADVPFAVLAECPPGRDGNLGVRHQLHGEIYRTLPFQVFFRHAGPDEHSGARAFDFPSDPAQARDHHVPPSLVGLSLADDGVLAGLKRQDAGDLDRREDAVIVVALDSGKGADHLGVSGAETDPPAGHVVGLGHRDKLHADVLRAAGLEEGRGGVPVKTGPPVGEIVDYHDAAPPGQIHHSLEKLHTINGHRGGIVRVIQKRFFVLTDQRSMRYF